jgi:AcrR family transcriptional regulator
MTTTTDPPLRTPARRDSGDETRGRILAEALGLIAEQGFSDTSTREIAERLGFTKAALYYHFRSKEDLLAALVRPAVDDMAALVEAAAPGAGAAARRKVVEGYVALVAAHAELSRVLMEDPSVRHLAGPAFLPVYERLGVVLSGSEAPDACQRAQVRAALAAARAALLKGHPSDDERTLREVAVAAACAVLGLPHARRPREDVR